jgi:hypothetical protein
MPVKSCSAKLGGLGAACGEGRPTACRSRSSRERRAHELGTAGGNAAVVRRREMPLRPWSEAVLSGWTL